VNKSSAPDEAGAAGWAASLSAPARRTERTTFEYRTTTGRIEARIGFGEWGRKLHSTTPPVPPPGDGWRLHSATVNGVTLYFFWERVCPA